MFPTTLNEIARIGVRAALVCLTLAFSDAAAAQDGAAPMEPVAVTEPSVAPAQNSNVGPVTNLPLPRFVSLKASKANVRRGPSLTHRIDWVFLRRNMPLQIVAEYGHWRQVRDQEGLGGWIHYSLLSGTRTVLVQQDKLELRYQPHAGSQVVAVLEANVVADLDDCGLDWCRLSISGYRGWAPKSALWGVDPDEIRD